MVGECSNHGFVAHDALEDNFPVGANCACCGEELERIIAVPSQAVEENGDVTMEFDD